MSENGTHKALPLAPPDTDNNDEKELQKIPSSLSQTHAQGAGGSVSNMTFSSDPFALRAESSPYLFQNLASTSQVVQEARPTYADPFAVRRDEDDQSDTLSLFAGGQGNESFRRMPMHMKLILSQMTRLTDAERVQVLRQGIKTLNDTADLYGGSSPGSTWYLPAMKANVPDSPYIGVRLHRKRCLHLFVFHNLFEIDLPMVVVYMCLIVALWFMVWNIAHDPHHMQPGGILWEPLLTIVFSSIVGGFITRVLQLPPLVGVLWMGIFWSNIPGHLSNVYVVIRQVIKSLALTIILLRAGLSLNLKLLRPMLGNAFLLALLPLSGEAVVHTMLAKHLFKYDTYEWAFLHGLVAAASSPAVVVPGVLYVQGLGHGTKGGPPLLMISSIALETSIVIWAINFVLGLIFNNNSNIALPAGLAPVQIVLGVLFGISFGITAHFIVNVMATETERPTKEDTELVHKKTLVLIIAMSVGIIFYTNYHTKYAGGGAIALATFGATITHLWGQSEKKEYQQRKKHLYTSLTWIWDNFSMPTVFALVGANIKLNTIFTSYFFGKACACLFTGMATRITLAIVASIGTDFAPKERLLLGLGWVGKATIQAALGSTALDNAKARLSAAKTPEETAEAQKLVAYGMIVANIAVFGIAVAAPTGSMCMKFLGPRWCRKDGGDEKDDNH